ncbi:MAG TPA: VOC family protein [Phenylobacterium sp.]|jgi:catechol 2,3-dioxygenase-like lactoylglutathione lyase family enzyme|uniref:VOC family protein n=1 Tax=Phenylobacterium sp. TaxID=1871053 RepID=UPI002D252119|nr:VOC family protein [Phenylobacterium sp.]HZZ68908.1 VOC family protein [Phenylobacterium sp.]
MLTSARLQTLVWTSRMAEARRFYEEVLGLTVTGQSHGAWVFDVSGGELRLSPVPSTKPSEHTVLGFAVPAADAIAAGLAQTGVATERVEGFRQEANGVWRAADGTRVVWFRDPDGNLLSAVQYA